MLEAGAVIAKFKADISELKSGIAGAQSAVSNFVETNKKGFNELRDSVNDFNGKVMLAGTVVVGALTAIGKVAIDSAADMEQARIAFTTMFGSAKDAKQLMQDISDFAIKTPFELPQLVEGAKRLAAYNISAKDMIPTLKMLGDISSAVGTDKLPNLILAFGQVKAATKLTGMELRQFTETGVPLLDELAKYYTKTGKAISVDMGGAAKSSKVDVGELNDKLAIAKQRLNEASSSAKTKQSTLMSLRNTVQNYEQKIASATSSTGKFTGSMKGATVTAAQVKDMISDGAVSFADVQAALEGMTSKGGKFFNMMDAQSKTFGGVMSNIRDQIGRTLRTMVGMDEMGGITEGGIFDRLKNAAMEFLNWLNANTGAIAAKFTEMVNGISAALSSPMVVTFFTGLVSALQMLGAWIIENQALVLMFLQGFAIALGSLMILGGILNLINLLFNPITWIILAITALYVAWQTNFWGIRDITQQVFDFIMALLAVFAQIWESYHTGILNFATGIWNLIAGVFKIAFSLITGFLTAFLQLMTGNWQGALNTVKLTAENVWSGIKQVFLGALQTITGALQTFFNQFSSWIEGIYNKAIEWGKKIKDALEQMSPFHKSSPSLVQYVERGVGMISASYQGLADEISAMEFKGGVMQAAGVFAGNEGQGGGKNVSVTQYIENNVQDSSDVQMINERLAFLFRNTNL